MWHFSSELSSNAAPGNFGHVLRLLLLLSVVCPSATDVMAQHMNAAGAPCQSKAPDSPKTECFLAESKKADENLNAFYGKLRIKLRSDELTNLQLAQRLWLQFRDANCKAEYSLYGGGSAGPTVRAACVEAMTRQRTIELKTMYGWLLEK